MRISTLVLLFLAGCGGPAAAPSPQEPVASAAPDVPLASEILNYSLELAIGHRMDFFGNVEDQDRFNWQDASGATHTVEAPAELKPLPEGLCIYLVAGADNKPVVPLKVVQIGYLEYCMVGPGPKVFSGTIREERETTLIKDGQRVSLKSVDLMLQPSAEPDR